MGYVVKLLKTLKVEHFFEMIRNVENGQFLQAVKFNDFGNFFSKPLAKIGGFAAIFARSGSPSHKGYGLKYALKSVPGLADVGVPNGVGDGPRGPP